MCSVDQELGNAVDSLGGAVNDTLDKIGNTVDGILSNPMPIIQTVALTYALGPSGFGVASATTAPIIASAAISAANGGSIEKIALSAAASYAGAQIGQAVGSQFAPTVEKIDPAFADQALVQRVVTSASGAAATTALRGGNLTQILNSAVSSSVAPMVQQALVSQGINPGTLPSNLISNATSAATNAILGGRSISDAVMNSVAVTGLTSAISSGLDKLKQSQTTLTNNANTLNQKSAALDSYYTNYVEPLQDQAVAQYSELQNIQQQYVSQYNTYKSAYDNYTELSNAYKDPNWWYNNGYMLVGSTDDSAGTWYKITGFDTFSGYDYENGGTYTYQLPKLGEAAQYQTSAEFAAAANKYAKIVNDMTPNIEALATSYNTAKANYEATYDQATTVQLAYKNQANTVQSLANSVNTLTESVNKQASDLGTLVAKYNDTINEQTNIYTTKIGDQTVKEADTLVQLFKNNEFRPATPTDAMVDQYSKELAQYKQDGKDIVVGFDDQYKPIRVSDLYAFDEGTLPKDFAIDGGTNYNKLAQDIVADELGGIKLAQAVPISKEVYTTALERARQPLLRLVQDAANDPEFATKLPQLETTLKGMGTSIAKLLAITPAGVATSIATYLPELSPNERTELERRLNSGKIELSPSAAGAGRGTVFPPFVTFKPATNPALPYETNGGNTEIGRAHV